MSTRLARAPSQRENSVKAIETRYAGYRFRSRLEARWAVLFDHLGIKWEYEPQGYACTYRLTLDEGTFPYLPDFWFPDLELYGEVKASLTHPELTRLLNAAASLSSNDGDGCGADNGGHDLVVFGNVPPANVYRVPTRLHMHKGDLNASGWAGDPGRCVSGHIIAADYGGDPGIYDGAHDAPERIAQWLTRGSWADQWTSWPEYQPLEAAYTVARSARFEHDQSGG